jgi:site-specific recombinase XerD
MANAKTYPIKDIQAIDSINNHLLEHSIQEYALFKLGINTTLYVGELLALTVGQVKYLEVGNEFEAFPSKNIYKRVIKWNQSCYDAVYLLLETKEIGDDGYLFTNTLGNQITLQSMTKIVKRWFKEPLLKKTGLNYSGQSLRQSLGFQMWIAGIDVVMLMHLFGKESERNLRAYLGIDESDIQSDVIKISNKLDAFMKVSL